MRRSSLAVAVSIALVQCALAATPAAAAQALTPATPAAVATATDPSLLVLRSGIFDPAQPLPAAADPRLARTDSRHVVVQFDGVTRDLDKAIVATGARVVGYLPNTAYVVRLDGDAGLDKLRAIAGVRWAGHYTAAWKVDPALLDANAGPTPIETVLEIDGFAGESANRIGRAVHKLLPNAEVRIAREDANSPRVRIGVAMPPAEAAIAIAAIDGVAWVGRHVEPRLMNDDSIGPMQANAATGSPIWDRDIIGTGQIVAVSDSGLDRNESWFTRYDPGTGVINMMTDADNTTPPAIGNTYPARKVYGYWVQPGATAYDNNADCGGGPTGFHGTHVVGTVAGDRGATATPTDPAHDTNGDDGMAPNAQILFQDIGNDTTGCLSGLGNLRATIEQARNGGAHISSNSWGAGTAGAYSGNDVDVDAATWAREDMLFVVAAGNDGPGPTSIGSPGNSKNAVTVGATGHGNSLTIASFSSRGPTVDGRIKPDIVAPGSAIVSAAGNTNNNPVEQTGTSKSLSGTSMATPTISGATALLRQYFEDGFYPRGTRTAGDATSPNGALMKAVMLNGSAVLGTWPTNTFGWGRMFLNLYFNSGVGGGAGDTRRMRYWERTHETGLATGETHVYVLNAVAPGEELRVTLTWFDPEAGLGAAVSLVNNLNLEVEGPGATLYRGNVFGAGQSTTGGTADARNSVEQVRLVAPAAGIYTLRVIGSAVPGNGREGSTRQGYALVASGGIGLPDAPPVAAPTAPAIASNDTSGVGIAFSGSATQGFQLYRAPGSCVNADPKEFRLAGSGGASPIVDDRTQGGYTYAYRVRGVAGDVEGSASACVDVVSADTCTRLPTFNGAAATRDFTNASCSVALNWPAGSTNCPNNTTVSYRVERDTHPYFTNPTLVATVPPGSTSYTDATVTGGTPYYYRLAAVDSGGNQSPASPTMNTTPVGANGPAGDYIDDADDNTYMQLQGPWRVTNQRAGNGTFSYKHAADGQTYAPDTCASITTLPIRVGANATLSYQARYDLELNWDGLAVEISNDGGATWSDLPPAGGYPGTLSQTQNPPINACGFPSTRGVFTGTTNGNFNNYTSSLSAYAGQTVQIRWRFSSDPGFEEEGFYLDNVRIPNSVDPDVAFSSSFEAGDSGVTTPPGPGCQ
jgi:hypothetical protein